MHQPIHTKSALLSQVINLIRLGELVRIFGRERAACPIGAEWLLARCDLKNPRREPDLEHIRREPCCYGRD